MTPSHPHSLRRLLMAGAALGLLAACNEPLDLDMRGLGGSSQALDTTQAVQSLPNRPRPDNRGVISYPNYQVVVAQRDDTINAIAGRLGLNADQLARYNGIQPDAVLRRDEVIALPTRVAEPSPATGAATTGPIQPSGGDLISNAGAAISRAGNVTTTPLGGSTPASTGSATAAPPSGTEPIRHQVQRGETAYSIARLYNVPVRSIAEWNGLGADLAVREGQQILVPQGGGSPPANTLITQPGQGSATPTPPSASTPLPAENPTPAAAAPAPAPTPAPAVQAPATAPSASNARLAAPVSGSIIRAYNPPRNEGVDFGVPAGTAVKAADAGTVAAVTTDTNGVAIVVIRHSGNLLTVYTNLEGLTVARGATVTRGQTIGKVKAGDPSFLHFEVRQGTSSVDPANFLP